jgi:hypothetical protein
MCQDLQQRQSQTGVFLAQAMWKVKPSLESGTVYYFGSLTVLSQCLWGPTSGVSETQIQLLRFRIHQAFDQSMTKM